MSHSTSHHPELSLLVPIHDSEEWIGREIRAAVQHLSALGRRFEVVAVNDGCRDNSLAIVQLLAQDLPALKVICRDAGGRSLVRAATEASAPVVVALHALGTTLPTPWAPLGWALSRIEAGQEAVVVRSRYVVARRLPCLPAFAQARGRGDLFERAFERHARDLRLDVVGSRRATTPTVLDPVRRLARLASGLIAI